MNAVLRNFKCNNKLCFCEECFKTYNSHYMSAEQEHICLDTPEEGNKIVSATLHNDITVIDSYAFVTAALSKFPATFNIKVEKKGFYPHLFKHPELWNYEGPISPSQYYDPDTFSPLKHVEFLQGTMNK